MEDKKLNELFPDGKTMDTLFENDNIENEWLTTKEAAKYLRISPKTLLNLSSLGKIIPYKLGRSNRYLKSELRNLLLASKPGGSNDH